MSSRIKGVSLINTLAILREVLGGNRFQALVSTCPQDTQQLIRRTLIAGEWISVDVWGPFIQAIYEQVFRRDEVQFRRLLRAVCKRDFGTVYRQYVTQTSPEEVLDKSATIFGAYFDSGSLVRVSSPNEPTPDEGVDAITAQTLEQSLPSSALLDDRIMLQMRDFETYYPIYAVAMQAYLEQVLSMAGAPQVTISRAQEYIRDGKLYCDYLIDLGTTASAAEA